MAGMTPSTLLTLVRKYSMRVIRGSLGDEERKNIAYRHNLLNDLADKYGGVGLVPICEFEEKAGITKTRDNLVRHVA